MPFDGPIRTEGPHYCKIDIYKSEEWVDAVPQFVDQNGDPFDLSGITLNLYIRPTFDYSTPIAHLTNESGGELIVESASEGLLVIDVERSVVDDWPVGSWFNFLNMHFIDPDLGPMIKTVWRGPCNIHAGRVTD